MLNEYELFYGAAMCRLVQDKIAQSISPFLNGSNSSYIVNNSTGIYIKYSSKRLSPWRFTFLKSHKLEIDEMKKRLNKVYMLLVCNTDGIACLSYDELKSILGENLEINEWISASRNKRQKYAIKGSNGFLRLKIGVNDCDKIKSSD